VLGLQDGTLRVWDMATSAVVAAVVPSAGRTLVPGDTSAALGAVEQPAVGAVAHSGDGSFLVAGSSNATLALWDCRTAAIARQQKTERSVPQVGCGGSTASLCVPLANPACVLQRGMG
jgi:WD40 repeat protein